MASNGCGSEPAETETAVTREIEDPKTLEFVVRSKSYTIDAIYRSMKGPEGAQALLLGRRDAKPELLWITSYKTRIIDPTTGEKVSDEFMCHSNLGIHDMDKHARIFGSQRPGRSRLFTLSQGTMDVEFQIGRASCRERV